MREYLIFLSILDGIYVEPQLSDLKIMLNFLRLLDELYDEPQLVASIPNYFFSIRDGIYDEPQPR